MNEGWQCPCCKMVYAPFVSSCGCQAKDSNPLLRPDTGMAYFKGLRSMTNELPQQAMPGDYGPLGL